MNLTSLEALIYTDGASRGNPGDSGAGIVIKDGEKTIKEIKKYLGIKTNNQAEYEALILALIEAHNLSLKKVRIHTDSQLLANHINGLWKVRHDNIKPLYKKAMKYLDRFDEFSINYIPRELNKEADSLANLAIDEYSN